MRFIKRHDELNNNCIMILDKLRENDIDGLYEYLENLSKTMKKSLSKVEDEN